MTFLKRAAAKMVIGGSVAAGLQHEQREVVSTPRTTELMHDDAEAEIAGTPHIVEFPLNRAMRREIGGKALEGILSAPEGPASIELEESINVAYDLASHRARSTQRTQS